MSKRGIFFVSLILLAFLPASLHAATASRLQVNDVRYGGAGTKTRIVLDINQKTDFRVFLLSPDGAAQPYRIVLDLPPVEWKTYTARFASTNRPVKSYRSGVLDDGLTRVIFDVNQPVTIDDAFMVPKTSMTKDRLVIDITNSSLNAFNAQKSRVFGNRNLVVNGGTPVTKSTAGDGYAAQQNAIVKHTAVTTDDSDEEDDKPAAPVTAKHQKIYTVVVDAGHGGEDPGAEAYGLHEKNITLAVAQELRHELEETGRYKVVLTRDHDVYIKLHDRVDISRAVHADLFVSIHADKVNRNNIRGASIYTLSEKASDAETGRLAEEENNSGFVAGVDLSQESQDVADILLDLAMREKMNESNMFARLLTHAFIHKNVRLLPNSHRSAGFAVLKAPDVPSVLIETGFISNENEAKLLTSGQFQRNISSAILEGVDGYFRKMQALQKP